MYTRDEFTARRAKAKGIEKALGGLTAGVAVILGLGQLAFIKLTADRMVPEKVRPLEIAMFAAYVAVVGFLVWRMDREVSKARVTCPQCKRSLKDPQADLAVATGKCAYCGGQVMA